MRKCFFLQVVLCVSYLFLSEEKHNININFSGWIPGVRSLGKEAEPFSWTPKVYVWPFSTTCFKTQGIPSINFFKHKLLAATRLAVEKVYARKVYVVVFFFVEGALLFGVQYAMPLDVLFGLGPFVFE